MSYANGSKCDLRYRPCTALSTAPFVGHIFHFLLIISHVNPLKILGIFPLPAKSHFAFTNAIMRSLNSAGHHVTVFSPFSSHSCIENFTIIDTSSGSFFYISKSNIPDLIQYDTYSRLKFINTIEETNCHKLMKMETFQDLLKTNNFDAAFVEILTMHRCYGSLIKKFNIPMIGVVTQRSWIFGDHAISNPNNPASIPVEFMSHWRENDFWFRLRNFFTYMVEEFVWYTYISPRIREFHTKYDLIDDSRLSLIFINSHAALMPRPLNPNVIEIGGIHIQAANTLPKEIEQFIDGADHGVILFSFGSIAKASTMDEKVLQAFLQAFTEIHQKVIWKFEENLEVPDNVMILDWVPQRDILDHKNVIAFISHCGQGSIYEAIYTETPVIAVPLFGDQPSNAAVLEKLGIAVYLDINTITKNDILEAVNQIMSERFVKVMKKFHQILTDGPLTPQENVVFWTEYVARNKGFPT